MKRQGKLLFSKMMRRAIWRWIETYPAQFSEVCGSDNRLLGGSEILFDMCSSTADNPRKRAILWPLQTILLVLSQDLLLQAFLDNPSSQNRRVSQLLFFFFEKKKITIKGNEIDNKKNHIYIYI